MTTEEIAQLRSLTAEWRTEANRYMSPSDHVRRTLEECADQLEQTVTKLVADGRRGAPPQSQTDQAAR